MKNNATRTSSRKSRRTSRKSARKNSIVMILMTITIMLTMTLAGTLSCFAIDGDTLDPLFPFIEVEGNMYPLLPGHAPDTNSSDDQDIIQGDDDLDGQTAGQEANNGQDGNTVETGKSAETPKAETPKAEAPKTSAAKLAAVKIFKPKAVKKGFAVRWKKIKKSERKFVKRVEIQFSKDRKFKSGVKTVYAGAKSASKRIKGVKKGKYYVRVRACAKSGVKVKSSGWSTTRSVRVK